jgi:FKBP-type peptidyl-prolyl cis-trans isomerase FkpA
MVLAKPPHTGATLRLASRRITTGTFVVLAGMSLACSTTPWQGTALDPAQVVFAGELDVDLSAMQLLEPGLYVQDLALGSGRVARRTSLVWVHYITWLPDGTVVDTSVGSEPFSFRLGEGEVIKGWNAAIPGMQLGGNRRIVVRSGLAYGSRGTAKVPPGTTLVFQVELVDTR